jgi:MerR family mercuric resistance operon transcriptional regulator
VNSPSKPEFMERRSATTSAEGYSPRPRGRRAGYRRCPADAVRVVRFIKRAQQVGFALDDIAELLDLAEGGPDSCDAALSLARSCLHDLDQRIANLTSMRDALASLVQTCEQPPEQRECPLLHALDPVDRWARPDGGPAPGGATPPGTGLPTGGRVVAHPR